MTYSTILQTHDFAKNGYYQVGDEIFYSKIQALMNGTKRNIHPEWIFHNPVFDAVDWSIEPPDDISLLYKERAKRIREKYDYVVLLYSAGIDSHNAFESFIAAGRPVDEIVVSWAVDAADKFVGDPNDRSPVNCLSEWTYLIKPQLEEIARRWPQIKITVINHTYVIADCAYLESDFFVVENYYGLASLNRWPQTIQKLKEISTAHPNSVCVSGLDKPQLKYYNDNLYLYFLDLFIIFKSSDGLNVENFYWSPDSTEILRKQCHMILNFFRAHPQLKSVLSDRKSDLWYTTINSCIYPTYTPARFQVRKQNSMLHNEQFNWIWKLSEYKYGNYADAWSSHLRNFNSAIDSKYKSYKNDLFDGYVGFVTPDYLIGKI
jgi:hypothetical protein